MSAMFSTQGFMPHGHCYLWRPGLLLLHVVSDSLIFLAYVTISASLVYFIRRRQDVPFDGMFRCFGAFIVSCGKRSGARRNGFVAYSKRRPTRWSSSTPAARFNS